MDQRTIGSTNVSAVNLIEKTIINWLGKTAGYSVKATIDYSVANWNYAKVLISYQYLPNQKPVEVSLDFRVFLKAYRHPRLQVKFSGSTVYGNVSRVALLNKLCILYATRLSLVTNPGVGHADKHQDLHQPIGA